MAEKNTCASPLIWEEIDQSESYLVCSMYEEAASLTSSVLKRIRDNDNIYNQESYDMMESAGMVFVQSLKELGRAGDILDELKPLFVSVTDIPVQVLLTGACIKISEGSYFGVREFLEEFLSKWRYVDERYCVVQDAEKNVDLSEGCNGHIIMGIDQYLEVVEVYVVTLLGTVLDEVDFAISWIEKAALPDEERQVLLRRLHSLYSLKASTRSQGSSMIPADLHQSQSSLDESNVSARSSETLYMNYLPNGENVTKQAILKISRQTSPRSWWFWPITLKFGNARMVISDGKILVGCLIFLAYFVSRRKQANIKRIVRDRLLSMKKAFIDLWQLAFSYQVNPLAAVQPLPAATRGGR